MIEFQDEKAKKLLKQNMAAIIRGVEVLGEAFILEAENEVSKMLPTRLVDRFARGKVRGRMEPRVKDLVTWVKTLAE